MIYGRSDSALNRHVVGIGSSEIYRCVEQLPEIADSVVVCLERRPGLYYMPLIVKLKPRASASKQRLLTKGLSAQSIAADFCKMG
ncbi:acyl-coenzyme A synthetase/AMP-(fatty) acid ligase [Nitrobacteraceae bacterium AZCC 2161]